MTVIRYTLAISVGMTLEVPDGGDPISAAVASEPHRNIIEGVQARVEAMRLEHPESSIELTVRDLVVASDEWSA